MNERNATTPGELRQPEEDDKNPIIEKQNFPAQSTTTDESNTGNLITQASPVTDQRENAIEAGSSRKESTQSYSRPRRVRQSPSRYVYEMTSIPATGVFNVWQNPTAGMIQIYGFIPSFSYPYYGCPLTTPPVCYPQMFYNQPMFTYKHLEYLTFKHLWWKKNTLIRGVPTECGDM